MSNTNNPGTAVLAWLAVMFAVAAIFFVMFVEGTERFVFAGVAAIGAVGFLIPALRGARKEEDR